MGIDSVVERTAVKLSYLCEFLLLPSHALRLARIRMATRRVEYEVAQNVERELAAIRRAVGAASAMEEEVGRADLAWAAARAAALEMLHASFSRLPARVAEVLGEGRSARRDQTQEGGRRSQLAKREDAGAASLVLMVVIGLFLGAALVVAGAVALVKVFVQTKNWILRVAMLSPVALLLVAFVTHSLGLAGGAVLLVAAILAVTQMRSSGLLQRVELPDFAMPDFGEFGR